MILYGAPVREEIKNRLIQRINGLQKKPVLAIVQVGGREDSNLYIRNKIKFGEEIGVKTDLKNLKTEEFKNSKTLEDKVIEEIEKLNEDKNIDGIIVQLPLPENLDTNKILRAIKKEKDADGLAPLPLARGGPPAGGVGGLLVTPATARAVMAILDFYHVEVSGKKVAVIGQSILAGKPISSELEKRGAEVFRCDINTKNVPEISRNCDILVVAVGKAGLITEEFVNKDETIIDVGINTSPPAPLLDLGEGRRARKFVGDVDFEEVEPLVRSITPVPGGVGPVTVACLFENLLDLMEDYEA